MNEDWIAVYESINPIDAELIKGYLIENEINAVVLNQRDSSYTAFGKVRVMVAAQDEPQALELIAATHDAQNTEDES